MKQISLYIIYILFSCAGIFAGRPANAQEIRPAYTLSFEPLYLFNSGMRINLEKQIAPRNWLGINLTGYYLPYDTESGHGTFNSEFESIDGLKGIGIGGTYKYYYARKWFMELGAGYTFFDVRNDGYGFRKFREDGLPFYEYVYTEKHSYFRKVTANFSIGLHSTFHRHFYVEPYAGLGLARSFYDKSYGEKYNATIFGIGYRGTYPVLGIRLGFNIPPAR
ncbi:MAG: hypothetical protein LBS79_02910 [Tannerella sp.]|jgi:hypothetical protein|nr:hypothetical protein [Tannerella sp.]